MNLIKQNIKKIGPKKWQTGPAIRNDHRTIKKHIKLLKDDPEIQIIYSEISKNICKEYKKNE